MVFFTIIPQDLRVVATPTFANIKISGLTSGRVTYAGTDGLLQDSANLTFDGTDLVCLGAGKFKEIETTPTGATEVAWQTNLGGGNLYATKYNPGSGGANIIIRRARGTEASPDYLVDGDTITTQNGRVWNNGAWSGNAGKFLLKADGNHSLNNIPTRFCVDVMGPSTLVLDTVFCVRYNGINVGSGEAGIDYSLTFIGETSTGILSWMEDEDYFEFADTVKFNNGVIKKIQVRTVDFLAAQNNYTLLVDTSGNAVTITLPASPNTGQVYNVKCIDDTNTCTVAGNGNNIDGAASITLVLHETVTVQYDGTEWWII